MKNLVYVIVILLLSSMLLFSWTHIPTGSNVCRILYNHFSCSAVLCRS